MGKKMKLKGSTKKRKIFKLKYLVFLILSYLSFSYTYYYSFKGNQTITNEEFINLLLSEGNSNVLYEYKPTNIVNSTMKFLLNIDFTNPESLLNTSILRFGEVSTSSIKIKGDDDYVDLSELEKISSYIDDPNPVKEDEPIIYIYNTHQLENYSSENLEIYGITPNVLMASYILKEKLNKAGLSTIVEDTNMTDFLNVNGWNYARSYDASRIMITEVKNKYPSIKYFIDLHRDAISKELSTITINSKNYAKVLFVVGADHNNYEANLNTMTKLSNEINHKYPGLSRGVLKKSGPNVNGIYNQDISSNSILIELGAVDNTIEEVFNTIEVLTEVLTEFIGGDSN